MASAQDACSDSCSNACKSTRVLLVLGLVSSCCYAILLWLSWDFSDGILDTEKPTIAMLATFGVAFLCYWSALVLVVRLPATKWLMWVTLGGACIYRAILLPSVPMHEIDIYRYAWDGAVLADRASPYRYSPEQVRTAAQQPELIQSEELQALVALQAGSESLSYSLNQIHFGEFTSPYPPVSQAVFAVAAFVTPDQVSPYVRVVVMKLLLVLFDLATLLAVVALLREAGLHPGLNIAYGWCPLVLKEIANGGHLDSIAIFFSTLAIYFLVRAGSRQTNKPSVALILSAMILAIAIGAKLYPVVLLPLFAMIWWRRSGIKSALFGTFGTVLLAGILVCPMLILGTQKKTPTIANQHDASSLQNEDSNLEDGAEPPSGLQTFLSYWEMNDLIFMLLQENLRPQAEVATEIRPWFVVIPDSWSTAVVDSFNSQLDRMETLASEETPPTAVDVEQDASFLLARLLASVIFCFIAWKLAWRASAIDDPQAWCRAAMLTLAWFWLLCPTQNPWYWCWVVPMLPFARYRTWYLIAGCTMLYYLRFWLAANYPEPPFLGTAYDGEYFFHFVVVWVEFAPCLLLLGIEWYRSRREIIAGNSPV